MFCVSVFQSLMLILCIIGREPMFQVILSFSLVPWQCDFERWLGADLLFLSFLYFSLVVTLPEMILENVN